MQRTESEVMNVNSPHAATNIALSKPKRHRFLQFTQSVHYQRTSSIKKKKRVQNHRFVPHVVISSVLSHQGLWSIPCKWNFQLVFRAELILRFLISLPLWFSYCQNYPFKFMATFLALNSYLQDLDLIRMGFSTAYSAAIAMEMGVHSGQNPTFS